jgi:hypothetical protein
MPHKLDPILKELLRVYIELIQAEQKRDLSLLEEENLNLIRRRAKRDYELRVLLKAADKAISYTLEEDHD